MLGKAELSIRMPFGVALASAVVSAALMFGVRMGINWIGSQLVGWWTIYEYEFAMAAIGLIVATLLCVFAGQEKARRFILVGGCSLIGFTVLHIAMLKAIGYPNSALTTAAWVGEIYGQLLLTGGIAMSLAVTHLRSQR